MGRESCDGRMRRGVVGVKQSISRRGKVTRRWVEGRGEKINKQRRRREKERERDREREEGKGMVEGREGH